MNIGDLIAELQEYPEDACIITAKVTVKIGQRNSKLDYSRRREALERSK